jgi:hydroxymethylbilane synthase
MAVHSMKDVPTWLPHGMTIAAVLPREDVRDALISPDGIKTLADLPLGITLGTSSLRRQAQILHHRPDIKIVPLRGNVDTRLKKIDNGKAQATLLAYAGLKRMGLADKGVPINTDVILPAVSQGIIGIEIRSDEPAIAAFLEPINCPNTFAIMQAERAMLDVLDGSCHTPIGGLATLHNNELTLHGLVADAQGKKIWRASVSGPSIDTKALGQECGQKLRVQLPKSVLD